MLVREGVCGWIPENDVCQCVCVSVLCASHSAALGLVCVGIFETESVLGSIFLQVGELFAVDGSTTLPENKHRDFICIYLLVICIRLKICLMCW